MAVYQRKGTYWIDYYYQDRRYRQKIGSRRRDAEEALSKIKVKIAAGEFVPPEERKRQQATEPHRVQVSVFALEEFLLWSEAQHAPRHYQRLASVVRVHLLPYFGKHLLGEVTPKMIEDYKAMRHRGRYTRGRQVKAVKGATVNRELCCIKLLFRKAVEWGRLEESPARKVRMFKEQPKAARLLEQGQVVRLLEEMPDHLKGLVACAVYAGLRMSELFHLRWEDIDSKAGELNVVSREEHPTKNNQSRRIPMGEVLAEALRRHPRRLDSPYVFANQGGQPYDNIYKALRSAAQRAGIEGKVGLHQLRHAFCSHALMQGIDPRTVQKWMGHRDLKTTLRYAHVSPAHEKAAIQRLRYESSHQVDTSTGQA
jgi:integrase